ncbi:unnamed protein product [Sympodiomycopsis kandeliae]
MWRKKAEVNTREERASGIDKIHLLPLVAANPPSDRNYTLIQTHLVVVVSMATDDASLPSTSAYSDSKILFVSNNLGSSVLRINSISLVSVASYALFACFIRYLASVQNDQDQILKPLREIYSDTQRNQVKILGVEFAIFVVPLLLSVTFLSGTGGAILLNLVLAGLSGYLLYQARRAKGQTGKSHKRKEDGDAHHDESVALLHSAHHSSQTDVNDLRRRVTGSQSVQGSSSLNRMQSPLRRVRSYSESDEEELEEEAVERIDILKQRRRQGQKQRDNLKTMSTMSPEASPMLRVSVESAADQAWNAANTSNHDDTQSPSRSSPAQTGLGLMGLEDDLKTKPRMPTRPQREHDAFLTIYRSHMMLITIVCILAVDFPVFDRVLGKCETWGTSLMDLGVGSFVFSLGVVSASPYLDTAKARRRAVLPTLMKDLKKSAPLFALGLIRVISVKLTSYPEHVTEYGVHWNFFLTLAVIPILKTSIDGVRRIVGGRWSTWGLLVAIVHQCVLTFTPVQGWVLGSTPRIESILSANREGIVSLPGYLSIMLLAIDLGMYILARKDPYQAFRKVKLQQSDSDGDGDDEQEDKSAMEEKPQGHVRRTSDGNIDLRHAVRLEGKRLSQLCAILGSWAFIYWSTYYGSSWVLYLCTTHTRRTITQMTSRRLANLPYVLWVSAFNATFLLSYASVYRWLLYPLKTSQPSGVQQSIPSTNSNSDSPYDHLPLPQSIQQPTTSSLMQLINTHSFALFLICNILTGLINLSIQTMYTNHVLAFIILILYVIGSLAVVFCIGKRRIPFL